jgi:hypothetical protein
LAQLIGSVGQELHADWESLWLIPGRPVSPVRYVAGGQLDENVEVAARDVVAAGVGAEITDADDLGMVLAKLLGPGAGGGYDAGLRNRIVSDRT